MRRADARRSGPAGSGRSGTGRPAPRDRTLEISRSRTRPGHQGRRPGSAVPAHRLRPRRSPMPGRAREPARPAAALAAVPTRRLRAARYWSCRNGYPVGIASHIAGVDRNWTDLLQELRVAPTGVRLLTGLLLTPPGVSSHSSLSGCPGGGVRGQGGDPAAGECRPTWRAESSRPGPPDVAPVGPRRPGVLPRWRAALLQVARRHASVGPAAVIAATPSRED